MSAAKTMSWIAIDSARCPRRRSSRSAITCAIQKAMKTAVLNAVRAAEADGPLSEATRAQIARAFQDALIETLVEKTARAAEQFGRTRVVLGGGVACNRTLANAMRNRMAARGPVFAPPVRLATDNAAMIARAGLYRFERGEVSPLSLNAYASLSIPGLTPA